MSSAVTEHKSTVKGRLGRQEAGAAPAPRRMEQVVGDGPVRRIVFEEDGTRSYRTVQPVREEPPASTPEPAPAPAPAPKLPEEAHPMEAVMSAPRHYHSRWDIDEIHAAVDNLHRRRAWTIPDDIKSSAARTIYRTESSYVRETRYADGRADRRLLHVNRPDTVAGDDRRFVSHMVDRVIRNVDGPTPSQRLLSKTGAWEPPKEEVEAVTTVTKGKAAKARKPKAKKEAPHRKGPAPYFDYQGDIHPVIDIEGIGEVYEAKLHEMGVKTTARLCYLDAATVARQIGAPTKTVRSWQAMAQLAKVNGIGPQYAEAMARAGLGGIEDLKKMDAAKIADKVNKYLDGLEANVIGQKITEKRVATWKEKAADMRKVRQSIPEE